MKKLFLLSVLVVLVGSPVLANEWYAVTGIAGQDSDWYNPLNWNGQRIKITGIYQPLMSQNGLLVGIK